MHKMPGVSLLNARAAACFIVGILAVAPLPAEDAKPTSNPFFAMDTSFHRPELTASQQLDLVHDLHFAGVAWTEVPPPALADSLREIESRHIQMFTIYCSAKVTPDGEFSVSKTLPAVMDELKGHGTIIWLHIGGKGPAFDSLTDTSPVVMTLRTLADTAAKDGLKIAIYPHFGEWTAHFGDAVKLAKRVNHPSFGVTFNLCHCLAVGDEENIPQLLEEAGPLLTVVTINGADTGVTGGKWERLIQPLGRGTFDVASVLKRLRRIGFTGPIGFQGFGIKASARDILEPTMAAWTKLSKTDAQN
jgi:hypothetical protein